jgi:hypothetical protein
MDSFRWVVLERFPFMPLELHEIVLVRIDSGILHDFHRGQFFLRRPLRLVIDRVMNLAVRDNDKMLVIRDSDPLVVANGSEFPLSKYEELAVRWRTRLLLDLVSCDVLVMKDEVTDFGFADLYNNANVFFVFHMFHFIRPVFRGICLLNSFLVIIDGP